MKTTTYIPQVASCSHLVSGAGVLPFAHVAEFAGISSVLDSACPRSGVVHTFGDVCLNLALSLIAGGDDVHDITLLSSVSTALGSQPLPSVSTAWRRITEQAETSEYVHQGFMKAVKQARTKVWDLLGDHAPHRVATIEKPLVIDIDATLITAHSDKENAAPTYKKALVSTRYVPLLTTPVLVCLVESFLAFCFAQETPGQILLVITASLLTISF